MMKPTFTLIGLITGLYCSAQLTMTPLGHLDYQSLHNSDLSNLWAYTDELGNEYALVGVNGSGGNTGGLSVVDISDPANPIEVAFFPGPTSAWREVKTHGDFVYVTTEANYGLLIVDLSPLPLSATLPSTVFNGVGWNTAHSLFIDENGRLYLNGTDRGNGGVIMYDLTVDPMAPVEVGEFDTWYVHDCFARGDTLYGAHVYDGFFSIVDVSDPSAPVLLATQNTPSTFTHNVWLDDTGDHLFTTDEVSNAYVGAYNVSDPSDIQWESQHQSDPGSGTIPHNTYWLNDFLVTSYYTYGVVVYDASYPSNLVETEHYDSSPGFSGNGFNGDWGVCPFLPSGNIVVSDIETGLWILAPQYVHACWLQGNVRDALTTLPINNASVVVLGSGLQDNTDIGGQYATGTVTAGTYDVLFDAIGYDAATITGVTLTNGVLTVQDAYLLPQIPFNFGGQVIDSITSAGIADAFVNMANADTTYSTIADANGNFTFNGIYAGDYVITAGLWGWITDCSWAGTVNALTLPVTIDLQRGWYDDFTFDFNWSQTVTATTGAWQAAEPVGTTNGGAQCNPEVDMDTDCGDRAYVTGNAGGAGGNDDVDDGYVQLTSPVFDLTGYIDPYVDFRYWFYNGGGGSTPNDSIHFLLTNGVDTAEVQLVTDAIGDESAWTLSSDRVLDHLAPTADMRLVVITADVAPGHIVEGGIDQFSAWEHSTTGIVGHDQVEWTIMPNPSDGNFMITGAPVAAELRITDVSGRIVLTGAIGNGPLRVHTGLPDGVYAVSVESRDGSQGTMRLVIAR